MKITIRLFALVILLMGMILVSEVSEAQTMYGANTVTSCNGVAATGGCTMFIIPTEIGNAMSSMTWQMRYATAVPTAITANLEGSIDLKGVGDLICTSGSTSVTSQTAAFSAIDSGKAFYAVGCGAAGATLITTIASVTNATTVVLSAAPSTSVFSGTQAYYATFAQLDQSTNTAGEMRHIVSKPVLALRCNITAYTVNGSTATCQFLAGRP